MERPKITFEDKDKRRELLLDTSRRRLERTQEKLTLVRKKLLDCREEEKARWNVAERELAESCRTEQLRIDKLQGVVSEPAPFDSAESSLEVGPPSVELEELPDHGGRLEELQMELETARMELAVQVKMTAKLTDDLRVQAELLEGSRLQIEELTYNLTQEQAASELLLIEKGELERTLGDMQLELRAAPSDDYLSALNKALKEKSDQLEAETELATRLREELGAAQTLIDDTLERSSQASLREQELHARLEEALADKALDEERSQARHSKFEQQLEAAQERQAALEQELQAARVRLAELEAELRMAHSGSGELGQLQTDLEAALARQAVLEGELQAAHGLIDEALESKSQQVLEHQQRLSQLEELSQSQTVELLDKNGQLTELRETQAQLEEMVAARDSELSLLRPLVQ